MRRRRSKHRTSNSGRSRGRMLWTVLLVSLIAGIAWWLAGPRLTRANRNSARPLPKPPVPQQVAVKPSPTNEIKTLSQTQPQPSTLVTNEPAAKIFASPPSRFEAVAKAPSEAAPLKEPKVSRPAGLVETNRYPRPIINLLEAQIALARQGISSGSVDGIAGSQTKAAIKAFQLEQGLRPTGELDSLTREVLILDREPITTYVVTSNDLQRLQPLSPTWLGKSKQSRLDYETVLELAAEYSRAHPNLIRKLNPGVDWASVAAGSLLKVPDTEIRQMRTSTGFIRISLERRLLQVFDARTNLLAHFPCSIAQRVEKRPAGELYIQAIAPNPNYTFNPAVFPESAEARQLGRKLILPPGPNNPVGAAWISLSKPGFGIHGTPEPEHVGRTESHGCFRLANWNALHLLKIVQIGTPVYVEHEPLITASSGVTGKKP